MESVENIGKDKCFTSKVPSTHGCISHEVFFGHGNKSVGILK